MKLNQNLKSKEKNLSVFLTNCLCYSDSVQVLDRSEHTISHWLSGLSDYEVDYKIKHVKCLQN